MKDQDERRIKYKIVTLDLNIERTDEKFELSGYNLAVQSFTATSVASIKFNTPTGEALALQTTKYIESKFSRFFITNAVQAGLTMVLVIGEENFKLVPA